MLMKTKLFKPIILVIVFLVIFLGAKSQSKRSIIIGSNFKQLYLKDFVDVYSSDSLLSANTFWKKRIV